MVIFLMDLASERYVETKYGSQEDQSVEDIITSRRKSMSHRHPDAANFPPVLLQNGDIEATADIASGSDLARTTTKSMKQSAYQDPIEKIDDPVQAEKLEAAQNRAYKQQFAAFLVLEFGVIFHSVSLTGQWPQPYTDTNLGRHWSQSWRRRRGIRNPLPRTCVPPVF